VSVRAIFQALGEVETSNPLTKFYKAPLTQISAANALAFGYHINFVRPVGSATDGSTVIRRRRRSERDGRR
jgi:hypothetical protein